ncbi:MAG: hypothetical protein HYY06_03545 [Deltaproteobacteria bacterium]|nr:hypothetical protein [Deltaproteobacteria bacterium]
MATRKQRSAKELDKLYDAWDAYAKKHNLNWSPVRALLLYSLFRTRKWVTSVELRARASRRYDRLGTATTLRCLNHLVASGIVERKIVYPGGRRVYKVRDGHPGS